MVQISDLPRDLTEEVLSRIPVTSMRAVRFTCKKWNTLSKDRSFTKKHLRGARAAAKKKQTKEFQVRFRIRREEQVVSLLQNLEIYG